MWTISDIFRSVSRFIGELHRFGFEVARASYFFIGLGTIGS